jgi:histidyl-tRNA synthetase
VCNSALNNLLNVATYVQVPCVGVSIGIERIFAILEAKAKVSIKINISIAQIWI